jgi:hypothetical protein
VRSPFFLGPLAAFALALALLYAGDAPLRAGFGLDAYHHLAGVRELMKGEFPPRHNLVAGYAPQGHYGPYLVGVSWMARILGLSPLRALYVAGVANLVLFVLALGAVTTRLVGPPAARFSAIVALLFWGPWPRPGVGSASWGWPGTTSLADPHNFFYPNQAGLVLLLAALLVLLPGPLLELGARSRYAIAVGLGAVLVASHALTGMAFALAVGALAASGLIARTTSPRRTAALLALPALALALACLWPYYPVAGLLEAFALPSLRTPVVASGMAGGSTVVLPAVPPLPVFDTLGPALVGLPFAAFLAWRGQPFLLLWAGASLLLGVVPAVPLHQRFLFYAALPLQIAAAGLLQAAFARGGLARAGAGALVVACLLSTSLRAGALLGRERPDLSFIDRLTPEEAVVLTDPRTGNGVAGLTGRKVVLPENPDLFLLMRGDGARRARDLRRFFDAATPALKRGAIALRWGASYVLVDRLAAPDFPALPFRVLYEGGGYVLYDLKAGPPPARPLRP